MRTPGDFFFAFSLPFLCRLSFTGLEKKELLNFESWSMNGEHFLRHAIGGQLLQDFQKTGQKKRALIYLLLIPSFHSKT